jgi:hypothetical protein
MLWIVLLFVGLGVCLIGWLLSPAGRDLLARRFAVAISVDRVLSVGTGTPRDLDVFVVQAAGAGERPKVFLARNAKSVATAMLNGDCAVAKVSSLAETFRIVPDGEGWAVVALPGWLGWIGRRNEPDPAPAPREPTPRVDEPTTLEKVLATPSLLSQDELHAQLLAAVVLTVNVDVLEDADGPRARFPLVSVGQREVIPVFTSEQYLPVEPNLRIARHPFRLLLETMRPPRAPIVINPRSAIEHTITIETLTALQAMNNPGSRRL